MAGSSTQIIKGLIVCTVTDYFAHTGHYLVQPPTGPILPAAEVLSVSCLPLGARRIGHYLPRSKVVVLFQDGLGYGLILGAVPANSADPRMILPDSLTLCGMSGFFQEESHNQPYSDSRSQLGNFSAGRPADSLAGDWGYMNDLGMSMYLGRFLAALKASDGAKIEAFWGDDLLRLVGYNLEVLTACGEHQQLDDEGEHHDVKMTTPFPWEGLGSPKPKQAVFNDKTGSLKPNREESRFEPKEKGQILIPRHIVAGGYLGDIEREWVVYPQNDKIQAVDTAGASPNYLGLLEIVKHINGAFMVRSAKEISFVKHVLIPAPKRAAYPEDPTGDGRGNYTAAGQLGDKKYDMKEFDWGNAESPNIRPAKMFDYDAYLQGIYTAEGFSAHKKDWMFPEESGLDFPGISGGIYNKTLRTQYRFLADLPSFGTLTIDERQQHTAKYFASKSSFRMLDDGSVVIEDGYGSRLEMKGGSIFISCVGDIWMQPGRSFITWAPRDAVLRAGHSIDITAAKNDVRIKAEKNLHMLGGNSGKEGGVLIESRSAGVSRASDWSKTGERTISYGITLKSMDSSIDMFSKEFYIGRGQEKSGTGTIMIDAGELGSLYLRGQQMFGRFSNLVSLGIKPETGEEQALAINQAGAMISCSVQIGGNLTVAPRGNAPGALIVGGNTTMLGSLLVDVGVITNGSYAAYGGSFVGKLDDKIDLPSTAQDYGKLIDTQVELLSDLLDDKDRGLIDNPDTSPGNDDFQKRIGFSCRDTDEDLKLDETFQLPENRWQQMLRVSGGAVLWDEPTVKAPTGELTMPHPGRKGWQELTAYVEVQSKNFDFATGLAKARGELSPDPDPSVMKTLKSGYLINVQV